MRPPSRLVSFQRTLKDRTWQIQQKEIKKMDLQNAKISSYFPIIFDVFLKSTVWVSTAKFNFVVFIVFLRIGRRNLNILEFFLLVKTIAGIWLRRVESCAHVDKEFSSECVAVSNSKHTLKEVDIDAFLFKFQIWIRNQPMSIFVKIFRQFL